MNRPNPDDKYPNPNLPIICYIKNAVDNPNIIIGDYSYYYGEDENDEFKNHVTHHYDFIGDKLIIGKFCSIAKGVEFIMNGANHRMDCISTYPFYIMGKDWGSALKPHSEELPLKGDTVVGNDVWIGQNVTILPGVHIGDGAIIGANSVVAKDVPPYSIAVGNPCEIKKKRFDDELISLLEKLQWWNMPIEQIEKLIPNVSDSNHEELKKIVKNILNK